MRSSQTMPWLGEVSNIPDFLTVTSSTYTVQAADMGKTIICNSSSAQTITLPLVGIGFNVDILRIGAGIVTVAGATGVTIVGATNPTRYIKVPYMMYSSTTYMGAETGTMITKLASFTEDGTSTSHVATIPIPATAWLHNIQVNNSVLWGGGTATLKVGDTADDDGYFIGVDLKATDLLVGEVLNTSSSTNWGGKEGAYLVAATGRCGPTSSNFGRYYSTGSNILATVTVGTPASGIGRTQVVVTYSLGEVITPVSA